MQTKTTWLQASGMANSSKTTTNELSDVRMWLSFMQGDSINP